MERFNSKLFYCLLYLIPTVLSSGDAGNKGSICYLYQLGAWHLNCEASSWWPLQHADSPIVPDWLQSYSWHDNLSVRDLFRPKATFIVDSNWEFWLVMLWKEGSSSNCIGNDLLTETNLPWNIFSFLIALDLVEVHEGIESEFKNWESLWRKRMSWVRFPI